LVSKGQTNSLQSFSLKPQPIWAMYLLLAIIGLAFVLRVWGIDFGLPYEITYKSLSVEEGKEVHRAFKLGAGEYTWLFGKGGLYYLLFVEYGIFYVVSLVMGWVNNSHEFALRVLQDPTVFFLAGRLTVAVMGVLTCLVLFSLSKRLYNWRVALITAFIGATAYDHTLFSSVINVDIGMTLALWSSMLAYLKYEHTQQRRWLIGAGALGGIAIAFKLPGAVILPLLLLAIVSRRDKWPYPRQILKEAVMVTLALFVTLTIVAPEWTSSINSLPQLFLSWPSPTSQASTQDALNETIDSITVYRTTGGNRYLEYLFSPHNIILTISAIVGACLGFWRRNRWDMIWTVGSILFLTVISLSTRSQPEYYMMPIVPALWLLSSRAVAAMSQRHWTVAIVGIVCVTAMPVALLIQNDYEKTQSDTRVLAKEWIETHVASGAKILMDGFRWRFIPSPPLQPDLTTVTRLSHLVTSVSESGVRVGRGISPRALAIYTEAMKRAKGPTYELYSTVFGLQVQDLDYYVKACFNYVITSSYITKRFASQANQERFPGSVRFYRGLQTDDRFRVVYEAMPVRWQSSGPTIKVYKVDSACDLEQSSPEHLKEREKSESEWAPDKRRFRVKALEMMPASNTD
jgi:4-amino-4-deoxy-L-arabinose transferase-like glycosyltransferase